MIQIQKLKKNYKNIEALKGVSLSVPAGKVTGLIGPNGCGKTTLIKTVLGLVIPTSGEITVLGQKIKGNWDYRKEIGYIPQNPSFPENLTVEEILVMLRTIREQEAPRQKELFDIFEIEPLLKRTIGTLSGGMKQKVATCAAFMFDPKILILDEPTVGLDPLAAAHFKQIIHADSKKGKCILLVSHIMSEMEQLADDMVFLLEGNITFSGSVTTIRQNAGGVKALEEAVIQMMNKPQTKEVFK